MRRRAIAVFSALLSACGAAPDGGSAARMAMALRVPRDLAGELTSLELRVYDQDTECVGHAVAGTLVELTALRRTFAPGQGAALSVPPGRRTFWVGGSSAGGLIAEGCVTATLAAGQAADLVIELARTSAGGDGGADGPAPPDGTPDGPAPPDGPGSPDGPLPDGPAPDAPPAGGTLVVSEMSPFAPVDMGMVACAGNGARDEFVELYNPTGGSLGAGGIQVETYDSTLSIWVLKATIPAGTIIPSRRYYLIASDEYAASVCAPGIARDLALAPGLSASNGGVRLLTPGGAVIDLLGYGSGVPAEGSLAAWPGAGGTDVFSLERKANAASTAASMMAGADATAGNGWDSGDNAVDFVIRDPRGPQSSASPAEP